MSAQSTAAIWNAATETFPYTQERFITDTGSLLPEDADAYLRALDEPYKRYLAAVWSPGATPIGIAYTQLPKEERYDSEAVALPPPPPAEVPHQFDTLPSGTIIEKTADGFTLHPPESVVLAPSNVAAPVVHVGGWHGFLHKVFGWLGL